MKVINIFSPHIDDAFLSLGGCILDWNKKNIEVRVYNIFTVSNWTAPNCLSGLDYNKDLELITSLRKAEELQVSKRANFIFDFWDFLDFPLRSNHVESEKEITKLKITKKIQSCMNCEDAFFFPIGIDHPDHILISEISQQFKQNEFNIFYYEDMPYHSWTNKDLITDYEEKKLSLNPIVTEIDFIGKKEILKLYSSQVVSSWFNSLMLYSYNLHENAYFERYWSVR